jgi:predicted HTH transcriptional regulator
LKDSKITRIKMAEAISKSEATVNRATRELKDNNLLDEKESDKNGSWIIKVKKEQKGK